MNKGILSGKTIVVTRPQESCGHFVELLEKQGASCLIFPMIRIVPPESWTACDEALARIDQYDAVVFTSINAADRFCNRMNELNPDAVHSLQSKPVYAVGTATGERLLQTGLKAKTFTDRSGAAELARHLSTTFGAGKRILFPRSDLARTELPTILRANRVTVDDPVVYRTLSPDGETIDEYRQLLKRQPIDILVFFSPSAVHNFAAALGVESAMGAIIATIGTTTEAAATTSGFRVSLVSPETTSQSLVQAIMDFFKNSPIHL